MRYLDWSKRQRRTVVGKGWEERERGRGLMGAEFRRWIALCVSILKATQPYTSKWLRW